MTKIFANRRRQSAWLAFLFFLGWPLLCFGQGLRLDLAVDGSVPSQGPTPRTGLCWCLDSVPLLSLPASLKPHTAALDSSGGAIRLSNGSPDDPLLLDLSAYRDWRSQTSYLDEWGKLKATSIRKPESQKAGGLTTFQIPWKPPKAVANIIGEGSAGLKVSGYRRITMGGRSNWVDGLERTATYRASKFPTIQMKQDYQFNISGTVGSKITIDLRQNSNQNVFDQANLADRIQLRYKGDEDEVIRSIEAGNTNLSLPGTQFVGYSEQKQGLFGIKTQAKLGGLDLTMITSQDKSNSQRFNFHAGAQGATIYLRDYQYLRYAYYDLGRNTKADPQRGVNEFDPARDSIIQLEVYRWKSSTAPGTGSIALPGICYVDPNDPNRPDVDTLERETGYFERLKPDSNYFVNSLLRPFVVYFEPQLQESDIIGVYLKIKRSNPDTTIEYGCIDLAACDSILKLKLIKRRRGGSRPTDVTYSYEWKNVYNLGARNIDWDGLNVQIFKGSQGDESNPARQEHDPGLANYLQVTGIDQFNALGVRLIDNKVDKREEVLDLRRGHLFFPERYPFNSDVSYAGDTATSLRTRIAAIYDSINVPDVLQRNTQYYLEIKSLTGRQKDFSLGRVNILENSEEVLLNNRRLVRGKDYNIDYQLGQISFLNEEVLNPNADLSINFDYSPFLSTEKKALFGLRGDYQLSDNFRAGTTVLFRNETSNDQKPKIGQEPNRTLLWDADASYRFQAPWLTRAVNALPLVEAAAPSTVNLSGEIARSFPNPNTRQNAYLDDFEGSKETVDLGIFREGWTAASPPVGKGPSSRGRLHWYNPDGQDWEQRFRVKDIWPDRDTRTVDERTDVLKFVFVPKDTGAAPPESSWGGIMRSFFGGGVNLSQAQNLEVWATGDSGILHFDFGKIQEDLDSNGILNTEDSTVNGIRDNILTPGEDIGLDGQPDGNEPPAFGGTIGDPGGDNWHSRPDQINGTEGNRFDPGRRDRPDTEDLNGDGALETHNEYFEFTLDLADTTSPFIVPGTLGRFWSQPGNDFFTGTSYGTRWRLYRIPLRDSLIYRKEGRPDWNSIEYVRFWVTGVRDTARFAIATQAVVGNRWRELGLTPKDSISPDEKFRVAVINSQENKNYQIPPGVTETIDRITNVRQQEQSLVLQYENLGPGHTGLAQRTILGTAEDYSGYRRMHMFVHGPSGPGELLFFLRFGSGTNADTNNYYEYRTKVYPGWDSRNEVVIDFDRMTEIKGLLLKNHPSGGAQVPDTLTGNYRIRGNPTLGSVRWFTMGVTNADTAGGPPASGEIWADELRVTDVRRDAGLAARFSAGAQFSDFIDLKVDYLHRDAFFRNLTSGDRSGSLAASSYRFSSTQNNLTVSTQLALQKFLPPRWGATLPLSINYRNGSSVPRLKNGSDIVLAPALRAEESTTNQDFNLTLSHQFRIETKNWLVNLTLNRLGQFTYAYGRSQSHTPTLPKNDQSRYDVSGNYDLSPRTQLGIPWLAWSKWLLVPRSIAKSKLQLLPSSFTLRGSLSRVLTEQVNSSQRPTTVFTRNFSGGWSTRFQPFSPLSVTLDGTTQRDLANPDNLHFSLNPKTARFGFETSRTQAFGANYTPRIFSFMDNSLSYSANYAENANPQQTVYGRTVTLTSGYGASSLVNLPNLYQATLGHFSFGKPAQQPKKPATVPQSVSPPAGANRDSLERAGRTLSADSTDSVKAGAPKGPGFSPLRLVSRSLYRGLQIIDPVRLSYKKDRNLSRQALPGSPQQTFRFGFSEKTGFSTTSLGDQSSFADNYSATSGLKLGGGFDLDVAYSRRVGTSQTQTSNTRSTSRVFPDLRFSMTNVDRFGLLKKLISSSQLQSNYAFKSDAGLDLNRRHPTARTTTATFQPLAGLTLNWKNGMSTTLQSNQSTAKSQDLSIGSANTRTENTSRGFTLSTSYSFRAPHGIQLPLLRGIRLQSTLRLDLAVTKRRDTQKQAPGGRPLAILTDNSIFNLGLTGNYSFSSQVNGGLQVIWNDTNDLIRKRKSHTRELNFYMELRF